MKPEVKPEVKLADDDEAYLEADLLPNSSGRIPTDIADIIADSATSEQRLAPSGFRPNSPFGRNSASGFKPFAPQGGAAARRPPSSGAKRQRVPQRGHVRSRGAPPPAPRANPSSSQHRKPHSVQELEISSNSLVGSGNFDVLSGGIFRRSDGGFRHQPTRYSGSKNRDPSVNPFHFGFNHDGFFSNFKDFADITRRNAGRSGGGSTSTTLRRHPPSTPIRNRDPQSRIYG